MARIVRRARHGPTAAVYRRAAADLGPAIHFARALCETSNRINAQSHQFHQKDLIADYITHMSRL